MPPTKIVGDEILAVVTDDLKKIKKSNFLEYCYQKSNVPQCEHFCRNDDIDDDCCDIDKWPKVSKDCDICTHPIVVLDRTRGETVCESCGLVLRQSSLVYEPIDNIKASKVESNDNISVKVVKYRELSTSGQMIYAIQQLSKGRTKGIPRHNLKRYKILVDTNSSEYDKEEYLRYAEWVFLNLRINPFQKERVREIISKVTLKSLHSRADYEKIIVGICYYVLRQDNPRRPDLNYSNKFVTGVGLTKAHYEVIKRNLDNELKS